MSQWRHVVANVKKLERFVSDLIIFLNIGQPRTLFRFFKQTLQFLQ